MVHNDRKDKTMDDKENFTVRRLEISELPVLTKLFHYKDINKMILETMASMEQGIEIFLYCIKRKNYLVRYMLITAVQTSRKRCRESGFIFMHTA